MMEWWILATVGVAVTITATVILLLVRSKTTRASGYIVLSPDIEPRDPLLQSQIAASLAATPGADMLRGLRAWASGASDLQAELRDIRVQLRALQTYVLGLDHRYVHREEASWLSLQVFGIAVGIFGGLATIVWAVVELVTNH